ncbi:protein-glutamate methylesterase/protein-glutamine glutaminase [Granulicella sibirica]|uniref:Protein-glutamate methylesterase/protein-glutamine glutaminase n=1 Tax=Granulicella sibirica TaxID=2479048 RepID=A0A4Q0T0N2_9BACT|nr:chemotaxis response regulator protein-glutamate methylesterase [Granulicella sibirica]RXH56282.1 Chemotaxis response regulator protein-glutamate methylesterase CheB [Granulicella sibirica]
MIEQRKIKVLIVDDSAIVRKILSETINAEKDMEVIATAPDPFVARDKILALKPDVLTLDIEMPRMDGLTFLKKLMHFHPLPVIVISSLAQSSCDVSLEALRIGAVDVLAKPGGPYSIGELRDALPTKLRAAAQSRVRKATAQAPAQRPAAPPAPAMHAGMDSKMIIAIGASTGGTEAIHDVLSQMPANSPGMVITQHIPKLFSAAFAQRLNRVCAMEVKEAADGDDVGPGRALIAPGDFHMVLRRVGSGYRVQLQDGPKVCYQRPAVDVMFASVAAAAKDNAIGVLLTGMGSDGAQGMVAMRKAGASTIAQDEASCVVYGMPREAVKLGGAERVLPLSSISGAIMNEASRKVRQ